MGPVRGREPAHAPKCKTAVLNDKHLRENPNHEHTPEVEISSLLHVGRGGKRIEHWLGQPVVNIVRGKFEDDLGVGNCAARILFERRDELDRAYEASIMLQFSEHFVDLQADLARRRSDGMHSYPIQRALLAGGLP